MTELHIPPGLSTSGTPLKDLLERQERAITTAQLKVCGVSAKVITRLRREGWLHQKYRGVWIAGGGKLTPMGAFWAGHLATGGDISRRSACVVHALRPHTTQADHDLNYAKLHSLLLSANGRRGITPLNQALQAHHLGATLTESVLEEEFLQLLCAHGFKQPRTQQYVLGYRCDFVWPAERIVIETDGARWHEHRERDAQKDRELRRAGWTVDRVSYRQVFFRPAEVVLILEENGVPRDASARRRPRARRRRPAA